MSKHRRKHGKKYHSDLISLDRNFLPMDELSRHKAITAIATGRALLLDLKTWEKSQNLPSLKKDHDKFYAIVFHNADSVPFAKYRDGKVGVGVLKRDGYRCQFVGCDSKATTVDHLIPRCQGGETSWKNLVGACFSCNQKKGGRTLEQAGMKLKNIPLSPKGILYQRFHELVALAASA